MECPAQGEAGADKRSCRPGCRRRESHLHFLNASGWAVTHHPGKAGWVPEQHVRKVKRQPRRYIRPQNAVGPSLERVMGQLQRHETGQVPWVEAAA